MANINPAARGRDSVFLDGVAAVPSAGIRVRHQKLIHQTYYFEDIDDDDDVLTRVRGVIACAWQPNQVGDVAAVGLQTTGGLTSIRMQTGATNPDGWIHVLRNGSTVFTGTDDETTIAKVNSTGAVNGYVNDGSLFVNQKSATPNNLTNARVARDSNLRLQFYPFTTALADGDIWRTVTGDRTATPPDTLCSGIVAIAWQANSAADTTDACAPTLNAAGNVVFNCSGLTPTGYLWVWRRA